MAASFAQSAIALLIDMAQRGDIDPWDVQVIDVFDRCLSELAARNRQDLSHSGQAFLYASMLVLLKSDQLAMVEVEPETEDYDPLLAVEQDCGPGLPTHLERRLHRRTAAPPLQRRRVTLQELIGHLELIAATLENQPQRQRARVIRRPSKTTSLKAITQLAHQENLVEIAAEVEQFLSHYWQATPDLEWLDLDTLVSFKGDRVGIFWALLFLCSQSKVELSQSQFYQDLKLRPLLAETLVAEPA